jgi:hypothetical protein
MEQPQVDMSQIRGDWHFHMNYVSHAIDVTLARGMKEWSGLADAAPPATLDALVGQLSAQWGRIAADRDARGSIRVEPPVVAEFAGACRATKEPCDAWVRQHAAGSKHLADVKAFAESCRQLRALCDDLDLMREQKP